MYQELFVGPPDEWIPVPADHQDRLSNGGQDRPHVGGVQEEGVMGESGNWNRARVTQEVVPDLLWATREGLEVREAQCLGAEREVAHCPRPIAGHSRERPFGLSQGPPRETALKNAAR